MDIKISSDHKTQMYLQQDANQVWSHLVLIWLLFPHDVQVKMTPNPAWAWILCFYFALRDV